MIDIKIDKNIGLIYGCYEILSIGAPYITPLGQKKKNYICKCLKCGSIIELNAYKVTHNNYQFCRNCEQKQEYKFESLIGNKYGKLTVIERVENKIQPSSTSKIAWKCLCECGGDKIMKKEFNAEIVKKQLVDWIRDKFDNEYKGKNMVVAVSGGKDSSVVTALGVEALGKDRVKCILLPQYEQGDISDSLNIVNTLGIEYKIVNIGITVDSIISEMRKSGVTPTTQALINLPARIRMSETYFYAQCVNGIPSCNCNLSEDWIGYSTYGGDGFGSFAPLGGLTVTEVREIGRLLPIPQYLVEKTPSDGLCGKTDEDNLGFTYEVLDRYLRTNEIEDKEIKAKIDSMHEKNLFKMLPMPTFYY